MIEYLVGISERTGSPDLSFWLRCTFVWKCEYIKVEDFFEYVYYIRE
jgi:hypothetical protein